MNILAITNGEKDNKLMEINKASISTSENIEKITTRIINGYTVNIRYMDRKTFYQCMESAVKKMNDRVKYKTL